MPGNPSEVREKLRGNKVEAFKAALVDPPFGFYRSKRLAKTETKEEEEEREALLAEEKKQEDERKEAARTVAIVLTARTTEAEKQKILDSLTPEEVDILMKYIYRVFALVPEDPKKYNSSALFNWHKKIVEHSGVGTICRVFAEREKFI